MDRLEWMLTGRSRFARINRFTFFVLLFATYDATILRRERRAPHGVSLVNYIVRDDRTDESAMYLPGVREMVDGNFASTDPYLREFRDAPDIRPRLPLWIGWLCYCIGGSVNAGVLLLHALPPAIGAMLLVRLARAWLTANASFFVALLSIGGVCYQLNYYVNLLHLAELAGPIAYNPELHLFGPYSLHLGFSRFFSPGVTLIAFLLGMLAIAADVDYCKRRTAWLTGASLSAQLYFYPHAALVLGVLVAVLIFVNTLRTARLIGSWQFAVTQALQTALLIAVAAAIVAAPYAWSAWQFRSFEHARDILARVGFYDARVDSDRTPVLCWLGLAWLLKRSANRAAGRSPHDCGSSSEDRLWLAAMISSLVTVWIPGMLAATGRFPQPWLIPLRCVSYLVPLLVAYPLFERLRYSDRARPRLRQGAILVGCGYAVMLSYGEYAAGRNNHHLYAITEPMARFRETILEHTPAQSTVLTQDLRLNSYLVCETDRYAYIGYGAMSNAGNREMLERLMIPCIMQDIPFADFYDRYHLNGFGLPDGPTGEHWALHHGSTALAIPRGDIETIYQQLAEADAGAVLRRYQTDFVYLPPERLAQRFRNLLRPTADSELFETAGRK